MSIKKQRLTNNINNSENYKLTIFDIKSLKNNRKSYGTNIHSLKTEWEEFLDIYHIESKNGSPNKPLLIGKCIKNFFEKNEIGNFEYYHRAGKYTFTCNHEFGKGGTEIIKKFITHILKEETKNANIYDNSKSNNVKVIFR